MFYHVKELQFNARVWAFIKRIGNYRLQASGSTTKYYQ
jgi:hypothetical protein